jgi:hypothetical protein
MAWNSVAPLGSVSVRSNRSILGDNTTYIEKTMGNTAVANVTINNETIRDHFWDVDPNLDGHHRFIRSIGFTVATVPTDPLIGTGMDGVNYLKLTNGTVQNFYRNTTVDPSTGGDTIYQTSPMVLRGTKYLDSLSEQNIVAIPANCYGEILMYESVPTANGIFGSGVFYSNSTTTFTKSITNGPITFNSIGTNGLNISGRSAPLNTYKYVVTYRTF